MTFIDVSHILKRVNDSQTYGKSYSSPVSQGISDLVKYKNENEKKKRIKERNKTNKNAYKTIIIDTAYVIIMVPIYLLITFICSFFSVQTNIKFIKISVESSYIFTYNKNKNCFCMTYDPFIYVLCELEMNRFFFLFISCFLFLFKFRLLLNLCRAHETFIFYHL